MEGRREYKILPVQSKNLPNDWKNCQLVKRVFVRGRVVVYGIPPHPNRSLGGKCISQSSNNFQDSVLRYKRMRGKKPYQDIKIVSRFLWRKQELLMKKSPVLVPPVKIQAPVVLAALSKPLRSTFLSLGCSSKFALPPCTVIRSLGSSRLHSRVKSCSISSGLVSYASRTYCNTKNTTCQFIIS